MPEPEADRDDSGPTGPETVRKPIKLDQFLKLQGWVESGGRAKHSIQAGEVRVNGEVETRRGRRLRPGDVVEAFGETITVES